MAIQCGAQRYGQKGATLIVALIVLLALTLLGTGALQSNVIQARMTANQQNQEIAFQASEAGLLAAEQWLRNQQPSAPDVMPYGSWRPGIRVEVFDSRGGDQSLVNLLRARATVARWESAANDTVMAVPVIRGAPGTTIELMSSNQDEIDIGLGDEKTSLDLFRQTSRSGGADGRSEVILQSEYQIRYR